MKNTINKDMLRAEFAKVWGRDKRMTDYCVNKTASVATLPNGELIAVEKKGIETRFCFGESGYDYDDALRAAEHARTSAEHFKRENMRHFTDVLDGLREAMDLDSVPSDLVTICPRAYYSQTDDCKLASFQFTRLTDILDALGGSARVSELGGKSLTVCGCERRIATREEIAAIIDAYETARAAHEKKVNAYLKRYGTTKVHAWTYWVDA